MNWWIAQLYLHQGFLVGYILSENLTVWINLATGDDKNKKEKNTYMLRQGFRWIKEFLGFALTEKKKKTWQRLWCFQLVITARCCVYLTFSSPLLPAFGIYMFNWEVCCRFLLPICRVPSSYQTHFSNWQLPPSCISLFHSRATSLLTPLYCSLSLLNLSNPCMSNDDAFSCKSNQ